MSKMTVRAARLFMVKTRPEPRKLPLGPPDLLTASTSRLYQLGSTLADARPVDRTAERVPPALAERPVHSSLRPPTDHHPRSENLRNVKYNRRQGTRAAANKRGESF